MTASDHPPCSLRSLAAGDGARVRVSDGSSRLIDAMEAAIRRDPARRGLLASEADRMNWRRGALESAARSLCDHPGAVAIVTGFAVSVAGGPVAETDGPLGAVILADVLTALGRRAWLVTDDVCGGALRQAAEFAGLNGELVACCPVPQVAAERWMKDFLRREQELRHLIFVERAGPGANGRMHNMRGEIIDACTAPLARLWPLSQRAGRPVSSIGIGDGGNEVGMGGIARHELIARMTAASSERIACVTETTWTIVCGVSNWGASALAAATALLRSRTDPALAWNEARQRAQLADLVGRGLAIDGLTRDCTASVDGLTDDEYFGPWREIEKLLRELPAGAESGRANAAASP